MPDNDFILRGGPMPPFPNCSLGEYLVPKVRGFPQEKIFQVEAETGAVQTFGEYLAGSIRLSEGLKNLGMKENDVVGMMVRNSFEATEIVFGTWLAGGAIAPLPSTMTTGEMKHMMGISKPKFVFCEEEALSNATAALSLLSMSSKVILVGNSKNSRGAHLTYREVLADVDIENYKPQPVESPSNQLVAILPSSGTSGFPKGIGLTHENLIFEAESMMLLTDLHKKLDILQISQFFWVTGVLLLLNALTIGVRRVLMRDPTEFNVLKAIDQYKAEFTVMAPLFAKSLCTSPDFDKFDVSSFRLAAVGGSPLTRSVGKMLKEKWEGVRFIHCYGMTEISGYLSSVSEEDDPYSVGRIAPGVQVKIVDLTTGKSLKSNMEGEIVVKTPGLMKGYVGNEASTRETIDEDGWFHTGDLGYYNDSGQLYVVDRLKEMIKIMNMQVSPSEVEKELLSIPGIAEVSVAGVSPDNEQQLLLAMIVKYENSTVREEDIHAHVANTLSGYKKLTGGVYFVDSLPKTGSGKIKRTEVRRLAEALYSNK